MALFRRRRNPTDLGKSELKYIELAVLGIPGVYSDMPVYNDVVKDGINGLLAKDTEEWVLKIEELLLDLSLRENIRKNALEDVLKNYSLDDVVSMWDELFSKLI